MKKFEDGIVTKGIYLTDKHYGYLKSMDKNASLALREIIKKNKDKKETKVKVIIDNTAEQRTRLRTFTLDPESQEFLSKVYNISLVVQGLIEEEQENKMKEG